jgi:hypothetical protein
MGIDKIGVAKSQFSDTQKRISLSTWACSIEDGWPRPEDWKGIIQITENTHDEI